MNLKKYTKKQLGDIISKLEGSNEIYKARNQHLRSESEKHDETIQFLKEEFEQHNISNLAKFQSMQAENKALKDEIEALNNRSNKNRRSQKRRVIRLKNAEEARAVTVKSLFELYSTVLLEQNWNDRIEWKNDILAEIEQMIQYLSR